MKYWFVSYSFTTITGFGFGNCWVSGDNLIRIDEVQKWVKEENPMVITSANVLTFQEVSKEQHEDGMERLSNPRPLAKKEMDKEKK